MKKRCKKGVSPVVSTALLIGIVMLLAIIIFLWASSFIQETIEKDVLGKKVPIETACQEVKFEASLNGNMLLLSNTGNVGIYEINIKQQMPGTSKIEERMIDMNAGSYKNESISIDATTESITIIPVLLGRAGNVDKKYTCPEETGVEIQIR